MSGPVDGGVPRGERVARLELGRLADVPIAIAILAEAAWIAVFAGLLEAFALHDPVTGIPELLLAAAAGTVAARTLPGRVGEAWAPLALGLAFLAGVAGFLASPEVWSLLLAGGIGAAGPALAANPGGWLAAVAFVRGIAHARRPVDPDRMATVLVAAVPALALAAIVGGMVSEPSRGRFLGVAQVQVIVFLAASVLALALGRLAEVGRGARVDWRRNPTWLLLTAALVLATAGIAAWASVSIGHPLVTLASAVAAPLLAIGFIVGLDSRSLRVLAICLAVAGTLTALGQLIPMPRPTTLPGHAGAPPLVITGPDDAYAATALWILALGLALAVGAVLVLARLWLRRQLAAVTIEDEIRVIDRGGADRTRGPARRSRFHRRARPADAVAAYRALLYDLDGRRPVAREPGETPAEHARRLRATGHGGLGLDLLAADYSLARFGAVPLSDAETRRAVGRGERLRRALLRVPIEAEEPGAAGLRAKPAEASVGRRGSRRGTGPGSDLPDAEEPGTLVSILTRIRRAP